MDGVLLLIMTGLCAVSSHAERPHYHFVSDMKNWTEAQSYCREKYTDLATIDNMEEVKILNNMAEERQIQSQPWIGLYGDVDSWRWSLSDRSFYNHGETEFRRWYPGEPNRPNTAFCAVIHVSGGWSDTTCDYRHEAVCSDVKGPDVTFVLIATLMTWTEAQSFCRENYTDLASVRNEAENQKVREVVPAGHSYAWIGLFKDGWKWSDGRNSSLRYWEDGEPNGFSEKCAAANFSNSGRWFDRTCDSKGTFICYSEHVHKHTSHVMKVRFERKNSSLDLNDPAVMEAILKELKQKLKDQGVNDNIKLSWKKQSDGKVFHKEEKKTKKKNKKRAKIEL